MDDTPQTFSTPTPPDFTAAQLEMAKSKRVLAGVFGILLGALVVHKFILGYIGAGIIMLAGTVILAVVTCGTLSWGMGLIGLVEGIVYLTKSDEEFCRHYIVKRRAWF